jgi:hypothetical protein
VRNLLGGVTIGRAWSNNLMLKCSVISLDGEDIVKISGGNVLRFDDLRIVIEELQNIEIARQDKGSAEQTAHNSAMDEIAAVCSYIEQTREDDVDPVHILNHVYGTLRQLPQ